MVWCLPAVSMGLLSLVISPFQAATLLIIPSMVTNFWQLLAEGRVLPTGTTLLAVAGGHDHWFSLECFSYAQDMANFKVKRCWAGCWPFMVYMVCLPKHANLAPYEKIFITDHGLFGRCFDGGDRGWW